MATSLEESEKLDWIEKIHAKYLRCGEKIVKIGPVDTEIGLLILKKEEEITEGKIYSPVGKFAERAKKRKTHSPLGIHAERARLYASYNIVFVTSAI